MFSRRVLTCIVACAAILLLAALTVSAEQGTVLTDEEQLGESIFFDDNLSINQNQSCASCHAPDVGWTGPIQAINEHGAVYEGSINGRFGNRKPPSSAYATLSPVLHQDKKGLWIGGNFWDGRATGELLGNPAADQAQGPFRNPKEQALPDSACVVYRVCMASYPVAFEDVWGVGACDIAWPADIETVCATEGATVGLSGDDRETSDTAYDNIALSIAAYEDSSEVNAFTSKFDYAKAGMAKLTKMERLGWALFRGKAKCARCHTANGQEPLFTDFTYDNLGVPKNPENPVYAYDPGFVDYGLGGFLGDPAENGKVKVPTLRNVGLGLGLDGSFVKAYGHNGYFKSLWGIVHFYNTRDVLDECPGDYTMQEALDDDCWPAPEVAENVNRDELGDLGLTPFEEAALVAFMRTLSDGYQP